MGLLPRILVTLGLAILVVLATRWRDRTVLPTEQRCAISSAEQPLAVDPPPLRLADPDLAPSFRDALSDRHELRPDRRFLLAIPVADCLATGRAPRDLSGSFTDGRWSLTYRGEEVGDLPSLPDFGDALRLLRQHIAEVGTDTALDTGGPEVDAPTLTEIRAAIDGMEPTGVADALGRIDEMWRAGSRDPALLGAATRALVALTLLGDDPLELTDPLAARAMATLALAKELDAGDMRREEALLALEMGYAGHAHAVAADLPADDPVRLYVIDDVEALRRLADDPAADDFARRLAAGLPAADSEDVAPAGDLSVPPFLPASVRVALYVAERLVEEYGLDPAGSATTFERDAHARAAAHAGPFLDADGYASLLAAAFYGEMYREATRRLGRGSAAQDDHVARRLSDSEAAVAQDLAAWYTHLVARRPAELESDLAEIDALGPRALRRSLDALTSAVGGIDPLRQIRASHVLARRLDSRVDHLFVLGSLAGHRFYDPMSRERAYRRAFQLAGPGQPRLRAWMAMYDGDGETLERMSRDATASTSVRAYAFDLAAGQRLLPDERLRVIGAELTAAAPGEWEVYSVVLDYLEETGDLDAARATVQSYLDRNPNARGLPRVFAQTAMARLLQRAGQLDAALEWIERASGSGQNGAIGRRALIQAVRGDVGDALELAQRAVDRYPRSAWSRSVLAEVYWRLDRPVAAAGSVRDARPVLGAFDWREEIGRAFADAFDGRPVEEAVEAMEPLRESDIPSYQLLQIAIGLRRHGRPDLAFELTSRFAPEGLEGLQWMHHAYGFLEESDGAAAAAAWYAQALPPGGGGAASMFMFSEGHPELLWTAIRDPLPAGDASWIWLMRAAAFVDAGGDSARRQRLLDHFAAEDGDAYHRMGRYLMGFVDEEAMLEEVEQLDRLAEAAFYVGLKAEAEGRMTDAVEWYRVVLDTGLMQEGEYRWALDKLWVWASGTRSVIGR